MMLKLFNDITLPNQQKPTNRNIGHTKPIKLIIKNCDVLLMAETICLKEQSSYNIK